MIEMTDPQGKVTEFEYSPRRTLGADPSCCGGQLELVRDAPNPVARKWRVHALKKRGAGSIFTP